MRRVWGQVRWPFGPPHLTLNPSPKNKNSQKILKTELFSYQSNFLGWVSKTSLFWQLGPKNVHPNNTTKIGVPAIFEKKICVTKRPFWTKNQNPEIPVIISFCLFSSLSTKNTNICWNLYFCSALATIKNNFQKLNLKHWKLKNPIFAFFLKKAIFGKLPDNWAQNNTQNDNWVCRKSLETTTKIGYKTNLDQILTPTWTR